MTATKTKTIAETLAAVAEDEARVEAAKLAAAFSLNDAEVDPVFSQAEIDGDDNIGGDDELDDANDGSIQVDDDVPLPTGRATQNKYPWETLDVGNSFFVPDGKLPSFNTACAKKNKDNKKHYIARKFTGKNGVIGVRVWRDK